MFEDQMTDTDTVDTQEPHAGDAGSEAESAPVEVVEDGWTAHHPTTPNFATLVVKRGGAETDVKFSLSPPAIIGRFDPAVGPIDVDLGNLPEGAYVSRKHAKIVYEETVWKVVDLGSSNGTFVLKDDFEKVEECPIEDGTEIALGNARFVFHLSTEPAS